MGAAGGGIQDSEIIIRKLKKDIERQKDDNSEMQEELQNATRALLEEKQKNADLAQKIEQLSAEN